MELDNPSPESEAGDRVGGRLVQPGEDRRPAGRVGRAIRRRSARSTASSSTTPSAEPLWARFYAIGTNRPMFVGRDGIVHDHLADIERERRLGYAWLGDWPSDLLNEDYPNWREKWGGE